MHRDFAASHTVCRQRTWRAGHAAAAVPPGGASTQSLATCFTAMWSSVDPDASRTSGDTPCSKSTSTTDALPDESAATAGASPSPLSPPSGSDIRIRSRATSYHPFARAESSALYGAVPCERPSPSTKSCLSSCVRASAFRARCRRRRADRLTSPPGGPYRPAPPSPPGPIRCGELLYSSSSSSSWRPPESAEPLALGLAAPAAHAPIRGAPGFGTPPPPHAYNSPLSCCCTGGEARWCAPQPPSCDAAPLIFAASSAFGGSAS